MAPKGVFWEHVSYYERLRKGSFGVARPEGVFEGVSERVPSGLAFEGVSGRLPRRAALVVGLEIDGSDLNGEFGPSEALGVTLAVGWKIYDSESTFSSDRANRSATPGRPVGDQRRGCVGRLSSSGNTEKGR